LPKVPEARDTSMASRQRGNPYPVPSRHSDVRIPLRGQQGQRPLTLPSHAALISQVILTRALASSRGSSERASIQTGQSHEIPITGERCLHSRECIFRQSATPSAFPSRLAEIPDKASDCVQMIFPALPPLCHLPFLTIRSVTPGGSGAQPGAYRIRLRMAHHRSLIGE
jgi:hypothetical protein